MKKLVFLCSFFLFVSYGFSQVHWLINADSTAHCEFIKSGKFINKVTNNEATPGYYIIVDGEFATEFLEDGKYYVKSKIEFKSNCSYTSTVVESNLPDGSIEIGFQIETEVQNTAIAEKLVEIKTLSGGKYYTFVWEKID